MQLRGINVDDALRFADLLSKSTHAEKADSHKIWAHEIITMLLTLYPDDEVVGGYRSTKGSALTDPKVILMLRLTRWQTTHSSTGRTTWISWMLLLLCIIRLSALDCLTSRSVLWKRNMPYEDFLIERRKLMATKIKVAFEILKKAVA